MINQIQSAKRGLIIAFMVYLWLLAGCVSNPSGTPQLLEDSMPAIIEAVNLQGCMLPAVTYDDPVLNSRKVFLTTYIDHAQATLIMEKLAYLDAKEPGSPINLYISSTGGRGGDTLANYFKTLRSPVNTYALDSCESGAAIVLAAGTGRRFAFRTSRISLHFVLTEMAETDDPSFSRARQEWSTHTHFWNSVSRVQSEMFQEKQEITICLLPQEALDFGIIDEIME